MSTLIKSSNFTKYLFKMFQALNTDTYIQYTCVYISSIVQYKHILQLRKTQVFPKLLKCGDGKRQNKTFTSKRPWTEKKKTATSNVFGTEPQHGSYSFSKASSIRSCFFCLQHRKLKHLY